MAHQQQQPVPVHHTGDPTPFPEFQPLPDSGGLAGTSGEAAGGVRTASPGASFTGGTHTASHTASHTGSPSASLTAMGLSPGMSGVARVAGASISGSASSSLRRAPTGRSLLVVGLPKTVDFWALRRAFARFGNILSTRVLNGTTSTGAGTSPGSSSTGSAGSATSRGIGYVNFEHPEDASRACAETNGVAMEALEGAVLSVRIADEDCTYISEETNKLFIRHVPQDVSTDELGRVFAQHGRVVSTVITKDTSAKERSERTMLNMAYVTFTTVDEAVAAIGQTNGRLILRPGTRPLSVKLAETLACRNQRLQRLRQSASGSDLSGSSFPAPPPQYGASIGSPPAAASPPVHLMASPGHSVTGVPQLVAQPQGMFSSPFVSGGGPLAPPGSLGLPPGAQFVQAMPAAPQMMQAMPAQPQLVQAVDASGHVVWGYLVNPSQPPPHPVAAPQFLHHPGLVASPQPHLQPHGPSAFGPPPMQHQQQQQFFAYQQQQQQQQQHPFPFALPQPSGFPTTPQYQ